MHRAGDAFAPVSCGAEEFTEILAAGKEVRVERIVSEGHVSPDGFWYDQDEDEWVMVLRGEAELEFEDGQRCALSAGKWLFLPAHERHRVSYTSRRPQCVWIAAFFPAQKLNNNLNNQDGRGKEGKR